MTVHSPANAVDLIAQTRHWLDRVVITQNLCPFAQRPFQEGRVRFIVTD